MTRPSAPRTLLPSLFVVRHPLLLCAMATLYLLNPVRVLAQKAALPQASDIDWVSWDQLSPAQQDKAPDGCCGLYIEPPFPAVPGPEGTLIFNGNNVNAADSGIIHVEGNLLLLQQDLVVTAQSSSYDNNTKSFKLENNVQIRHPGVLLIGSAATVDQATGISTLQNASYILHATGARGSADIIVRTDNNGIITIDNGVYTRCEPGNNSWLVAGDIVLNPQTGRGTARNVTLKVNDIPVLYLPRVSFPINDKRASGFLAPIVGSTRDGGIDLAAPYYLNLAPNYDATFTPRLQAERGVILGLEGRYQGDASQHLLQMQYLENDHLYNKAALNLPGSNSPPSPTRWLLNYDYSAVLARGWSAVVDYAAVSDHEYFQDLGNTGLYTTTQSNLYRYASLNYQGNNWNLTAATQGYQIIDPTVSDMYEPFQSLPRLNLDSYFYLDSGLEYGVDAEFVVFDRTLKRSLFSQQQIDAGALVNGARLALTPQLSLPWSNNAGFITPTIKYKYAQWNLQDQARNNDKSPSRGIFTGSVDSGLIFERDINWFANTLQQTLEPRLFFLYNQYKDQRDIPLFDSSDLTFSFSQLFRDDRFSGKDRVGDTKQFTLALMSRLFDNKGHEKAKASIGQIQYFADRRVTLVNPPGQTERQSGSALAGELGGQLGSNWRTNAYMEWNTSSNEVDVGNFQVQYQSDLQHILNFGYRYRDITAPSITTGLNQRINQTDVSAIWPVSADWGWITRWNYDHSNKRNLETIAGVQYSNCCWNVRMVAREWIDNDALFFGLNESNTGIFLQFELKGLGNLLGDNVSGILNNGISGYQDREYVQ